MLSALTGIACLVLGTTLVLNYIFKRKGMLESKQARVCETVRKVSFWASLAGLVLEYLVGMI